MFRLSRQVRFSIDENAVPTTLITNGFGGWPTMIGLGRYYALDVTLGGALDPKTKYLINIKQIDAIVRERGIEMVDAAVKHPQTCPNQLIANLFRELSGAWRGPVLESAALHLTPFLHVDACRLELPMTRLSQRFEFSASHRLHSAALSDEENRAAYGKCNNPHGHGHNYEVQVTLIGQPDSRGLMVDVPAFERIVSETVIKRFDHKHLNAEVAEFSDLVPSVENISMVIYRLLKPAFADQKAKLASITVWETPKTWCEYSE